MGEKINRTIRILPPHVVNRIAAGEVVERPASVVKELVENALDAGAGRIEISVSAGGRNIRVADDGCGMATEDARLAFHNHATSKIRDESDLARIETLGFRGEALASIAAVSRITGLTRTAETSVGTRVTVNEAGNPTLTETGCAVGTVIELADLFYNTPARLKFLKKPATELGHIEEAVQHLALSHPAVRFTLMIQDKVVLKTAGSGDRAGVLREVPGAKEDVDTLLPVTGEDAEMGYGLEGFVSRPDRVKNTRRFITFVNGRSVKCLTLNKAIEAGYASLLPASRYPVAVIFLTLPHDEVDVNVHPAKREVRYAHANSIFSFVRHGIQSALEARGHFLGDIPGPLPVSPAGVSELKAFSEPGSGAPFPLHSTGGSAVPRAGGSFRLSETFSGSERSAQVQAALSFHQPPVSAELAAERDAFKVIGQLFNTYVLLETRQGLMVVDQHIACERTLFEILKTNLMSGRPDIQQRVTSAPFPLTPGQAALLETHRQRFETLGFTYTLAEADHQVTLTGVPLLYLEKVSPEDLFADLLRQLEETGDMQPDFDTLIATLACHGSIRAGDALDPGEMRLLVERWLACRLPWTCPHGRPIAHTIQTEDLNRFFHRPGLPVNA